MQIILQCLIVYRTVVDSPGRAIKVTMRHFLAKTDPDNYSIDQFAADRETTWDGVRNAQAVRAIREMRPGDRVFIYQSGSGAAVVGLAEVRSEPADDPGDPKSAVVRLKLLDRLDPPTTLADIKEAGLFGDWALIRQGRLSTMAAPPEFVVWMEKRYPNTHFSARKMALKRS